MAVTRKASAYSKKRPVVNTRRSKKLKLSYVKAVPSQKIVRFNMGNIKSFEQGNYKINISLVSEEDIQIRDIALEAVRQSIHKDMTKFLASDDIFRKAKPKLACKTRTVVDISK